MEDVVNLEKIINMTYPKMVECEMKCCKKEPDILKAFCPKINPVSP